MFPRLPVEVSTAAAQAGLGRRTGVFRSLQGISARTGWLIVGGTAVIAALVVLVGGTALGLTLVPLALVSLLAYHYLLPPEPGRHWLAVHDHGLVELSPTTLRVIPWPTVTAVNLTPDAFTLAVAAHPTPAPHVYQCPQAPPTTDPAAGNPDTEPPPHPESSTPAAYGDRTANLEPAAHSDPAAGPVPAAGPEPAAHPDPVAGPLPVASPGSTGDPWFPAHPGTATGPGSWALPGVPSGTGPGVRPGFAVSGDFGVPVVLTDLVPRGGVVAAVERYLPGSLGLARRAEWLRQARRGRLSTVGLVALLLVPLLVAAARPHGGGGASLVRAAPSAAPAYTYSPEPEPLATTPDVAAPTAPFTPTPSSPTPAAVPEYLDGYADVCGGTVFAGAPAYGNPAPHFVYVSSGDATLDTPEDWSTDDAAKVQLVACVVFATGARLGTCRYSDVDNGTVISQQLLRTTWDVTVREVRTGTVVGHVNFRGADTACDDFITVPLGVASPIQYTEPTADQLEGSIGRYVH